VAQGDGGRSADRQHRRGLHAQAAAGAARQGLRDDAGVAVRFDGQHVGDHRAVQRHGQGMGQHAFAGLAALAGAGDDPAAAAQRVGQGGGDAGRGHAVEHVDVRGTQGQVVARHGVAHAAGGEQAGLCVHAQRQGGGHGVGPAAHGAAADRVHARAHQNGDIGHDVSFC
jgi:hypothetical protein